MKKLSPYKARMTVFILIGILVVCLCLSVIFDGGMAAKVANVLAATDVALFLIITLAFWRCPECKRFLPVTPREILTIKYCPDCGADISY